MLHCVKSTESEKLQPVPSILQLLFFLFLCAFVLTLFLLYLAFSFHSLRNQCSLFSSLGCFLSFIYILQIFCYLSLSIFALFFPISFFPTIFCFSPKHRMLQMETLRYIYSRFMYVLRYRARLSKPCSINFVFHSSHICSRTWVKECDKIKSASYSHILLLIGTLHSRWNDSEKVNVICYVSPQETVFVSFIQLCVTFRENDFLGITVRSIKS